MGLRRLSFRYAFSVCFDCRVECGRCFYFRICVEWELGVNLSGVCIWDGWCCFYLFELALTIILLSFWSV